MEVLKFKLNMQKKRKGIINVYMIYTINSVFSSFLIIDEFPEKYDVVDVNEPKMDLTDFSFAIYKFIISEYFDDKKPFFINGKSVTITRNSIYSIVYESLKSIIEK